MSDILVHILQISEVLHTLYKHHKYYILNTNISDTILHKLQITHISPTYIGISDNT